ncbi:hypothetical protein H7849_23770 [Alloacidobacterium dinghuense]|uniref:Uncharacterized protein n=1 Tax=Alloacidobacterium dinghuense TaxID=2763107 RepID=A0A7G8BHH4_9BACT|nr:hypothetical protein [Alloacidobacterium dinghuense]QNI31994.1 hypothetical protein H7849_23770 [Alloacidobacterium dinghuense]
MISPEAVEMWEWWHSVWEKSQAACGHEAWANIWIGVMLRRYAEEHPHGLTRFRTSNAWAKLLEWQKTPLDHDMPRYFTIELDYFLRAGNNHMGSENPWWIRHRSVPRVCNSGGFKYLVAEYAIGRVRTLEQDIAFEQNKRLKKEGRLHEEFIRQYGFAPECEDLSDLDC